MEDKKMRCFPAVYDERTKVLILGSFPGEESLRKGQYYGNKRNQFWKIIGEMINEDMLVMDYRQRLKTLKDNRIGLWDVVSSCEREGSLDNNIKDAEFNDIDSLELPDLKIICFNGRKAYSRAGRINKNVKKALLPSTSPANAIKFEKKLNEWRIISEYIP
ncbi:MAG: DNA-deoxyinosine glycosylase [Nanobdellota archaeon]